MTRVSAHRDQRRRGITMPEPRRITGFADSDENPAKSGGSCKLILRFGETGDPDGTRGATAAREAGERLKGRLRGAEVTNEPAEGCRPTFSLRIRRREASLSASLSVTTVGSMPAWLPGNGAEPCRRTRL